MAKKFLWMFCLGILGIVVALNAQELRVSKAHSSMKGLNCSFCHGCLEPSQEDPCLKLDPQMFIGEGHKLKKSELPPDTLVIGYLEEKYEAVKFPHRQHVHMASKSGFCVDCHHFIPPDKPKQKCGECHLEGLPWQESPGQIFLENAYHRKCLTCHEEWSKTTNCEVCHAAKDPKLASETGEKPKFREVKEPEKQVYFTRYFTGPFVNFPHKEHSTRKNVVCEDCHNTQPCVACHYQNEGPKVSTLLKKTNVHEPCALCHDVIGQKACVQCHKTIEQQKKIAQ